MGSKRCERSSNTQEVLKISDENQEHTVVTEETTRGSVPSLSRFCNLLSNHTRAALQAAGKGYSTWAQFMPALSTFAECRSTEIKATFQSVLLVKGSSHLHGNRTLSSSSQSDCAINILRCSQQNKSSSKESQNFTRSLYQTSWPVISKHLQTYCTSVFVCFCWGMFENSSSLNK